jgi:hypothetical protein
MIKEPRAKKRTVKSSSVWVEIGELINDERYAEAYELIRRDIEEHPDRTPGFFYYLGRMAPNYYPARAYLHDLQSNAIGAFHTAPSADRFELAAMALEATGDSASLTLLYRDAATLSLEEIGELVPRHLYLLVDSPDPLVITELDWDPIAHAETGRQQASRMAQRFETYPDQLDARMADSYLDDARLHEQLAQIYTASGRYEAADALFATATVLRSTGQKIELLSRQPDARELE